MEISNKQLKALSVVLQRSKYAADLGYQYGTDRDLYEALGYETDITFDMYLAKYERMDIAKAIINRPVGATWRGGVLLSEQKGDETELEKLWKTLVDDLKLGSAFARLDKMAGIGEYGVMLLGFDDIKRAEDWPNPVNGGKRELLYVKPFRQDHATIKDWDKDTSSPRYGKPEQYELSMTEPGSQNTTIIKAHWSRCIHVADGLMESEVHGTPRLKAVYNRLMDLEKIIGGSAEMFWRNARPGFQGKMDPEFTMSQDMQDDLQDQIDEYEHNLRRILINEGVEFEALAQKVEDPKPSVDIQIQMISAETGIPQRILTGSERGELASSEDRNNWFDLIDARREEYAEPVIVRPFVERLIEYGVLPTVEDWEVMWQDLYAPSDAQKAEVGKTRTESLSKYVQGGCDAVVPPEAFLEAFLGLDEGAVEDIMEQLEDYMEEEAKKAEEDQKLIDAEIARVALETGGLPIPGEGSPPAGGGVIQ